MSLILDLWKSHFSFLLIIFFILFNGEEVLFLCMWSKEFYLFSFLVLKMFLLHEIRVLTLDALFPLLQLSVIDYFSQIPILPVCLAVFPGVLQYFCVFYLFIESLCFSAFFCFIFWGVHTQLHFMELHPAKCPCSSCEEAEKITSPKNFHLLTKGNVSSRAVRRWRQLVCLFCCYSIDLIRRQAVGGHVQTKKHQTRAQLVKVSYALLRTLLSTDADSCLSY